MAILNKEELALKVATVASNPRLRFYGLRFCYSFMIGSSVISAANYVKKALKEQGNFESFLETEKTKKLLESVSNDVNLENLMDNIFPTRGK